MCKVRESDHRVIVFSLKCTSKIVPVSNAEPLAFSPHLSPKTFVKITLLWTLGCNTAPISVTIAFRWRQVLNYRHFRNILYCKLCFQKIWCDFTVTMEWYIVMELLREFYANSSLYICFISCCLISFASSGKVNKYFNHKFNKSTSQSVSQSTHQPTDQPTYRPTKRPTNQPTNQPTSQPTNQQTNQPTTQLFNQSINQQNPTRIFHERDSIKRLCYCIKQQGDFMTSASFLPLRPN